MADLIATHAEMARSGVDKYFPIFGKERPKIYTSIGFSPIKTTMEFWRMYQEAGYGYATVVDEATGIPIDTFDTLNNKDYYWVKRGLADKRSYEAISTDQYGLSKKIAKKMAKAMVDTKESTAAAVFNNHTSTGAQYVGPDGKAFIASDHGTKGGTWSNLGIDDQSTNADLSITALEGMLQHAMDTVNHRGIPDPRMGPFKLMVSTSDAALAHRLVASQKYPQSNDNDPNWAGGQISGVIVNPWLTDTDAWWLISADNGLFELQHGSRIVETERFKRTQQVAIYLTEKWLFHFQDARGVYGTSGV